MTGLISPETIAICLPTPQFSGWCGNVQLYQKGTVNYHKKSVANDIKLSSSTTEDVYLKWYQNKKKESTAAVMDTEHIYRYKTGADYSYILLVEVLGWSQIVPTCHKVTISCCLWSAGRLGDFKVTICTIEYGHAK